MKILVVEDNPEMAALLMEVFTGEGYRVEIAGTGTIALRLITNCDLAIIDLSLPDMTGADVAHRARAAGSAVPMIAFSGAMPIIDKEKLREAEFVEHLVKPTPVSVIFETVRKYLPAPVPAAK